MMTNSPLPSLILAALLLALPAAEAASIRHGAYAEARARTSSGLLEHNVDPGDGRIRWVSGISTHASTTAVVSQITPTLVLAASAVADVRAELGSVDISVLTTQARTPLGAWAESDVLAAGYFQFETTVLGAPGSSGRLRVAGSFGLSLAPDTGPGPSSAQINMSAYANSAAPGTSSCRVSNCMDDASFDLSLENGESLLDPVLRPFVLELDVKAGDLLRLGFMAGVRMHGGYVALLGNPLIKPPIAPAGGSLLSAADAGEGLQNGFGVLMLDGGLSLAPVEGLAQLPDGSYGFAAPVPEPASLLLFGAGLLLVLRRWQHGGR